MTKKLRIGGIITSATAFAVLAVFACRFSYFPVDLQITLGLQRFDGLLPAFMYGVSSISNHIPAIIIVVLTAIWLGRSGRRLAAIITGTATGITSLAVVPLLKPLVERPRPPADLIQVMASASGYSFPSGHATFMIVFYGFIFYLLPRLTTNKASVRTWRVLLAVFIGLTYASRIYLGLHWASDVLGGFLIGGLVLLVIIIIYCYYLPRFIERGKDAGAS